jgi:molybdopterin molybdotransferase
MKASGMITPLEAATAIEARVTCLPIESLPLAQSVGAILRENIYAERDQPPFDRVTMDGIAVESSELRAGIKNFRIAAVQAAGAPQLERQKPREAIEVMTGAVMPRGYDCVIPVEQIDVNAGVATLKSVNIKSTAYSNVHRRGSDGKQGVLLLEAGILMRPPEVAVAASAGMARVRVSSQPAIMVISTGDELVEPGEPIADYQVRRSNSYAVAASLRRRGFLRVGDDHVADDEAQLAARLRLHLTTHEVLILSGGVSMGKFDLVPKVLGSLGVHEVFHKIAQRPGKPMWFGIGPSGQSVFGLPGNPVSTLICLVRYVIPAIDAAMGIKPAASERLALAAPVEFEAALTYFIPVKIHQDDWGRPWAMPRPTQGSGDFLSLAGTDGFAELPPGPNTYAKGFVAPVYRW